MASYINEQQTIGATARIVLPNRTTQNAKRTSVILSNQSTGGQVITISIDEEAASGTGIVLNPGGSWEQTANGGYLPPQQKITAISTLAGGLLSVYEESY